MEIERFKSPTPGIFIFVGENRSPLAQKNGYTWWECQRTGKSVLSAKTLWEALEKAGLDPNRQIFLNLWDDSRNLDQEVPKTLKRLIEYGEVVVGLGKNVQSELRKNGIPHLEMIHPAARGKIRRSDLYQRHVKKVLLSSGK